MKTYNKAVADHYQHGSLIESIEAALPALGKTPDSVTTEDLAPVDEFHIGGRLATDNLLQPLNFSAQDHILDIGCGLGGASRYVSSQYKSTVSGIDLTREYIETGNILCKWLNLDSRVSLLQGSALSLPFEDNTFDGAYMLHVGMNIEDKSALFAEIYRTLKPAAHFAVYDVMRQQQGELIYPVPWAANRHTSMLATADEYKQALTDAGFSILRENNRRDFSLAFFQQIHEKNTAGSGPPPLGLHTLMQDTTASKIKNMIENISNNFIAPVEIITQK